MSDTISDAAFAALTTRLGFELDDAELARLRQGYDGLQAMIARLPAAPALIDEPSFVQIPPAARVVS